MATSQQIDHGIGHGRRSLKQGGFTLIELLVVMAIIAILMGMLVGVAIYANQAVMRARARAELQEIHAALQKFRIDTGAYPTNSVEIVRMRQNLPPLIQSRFDKRDAIMPPPPNPMKLPLDPWKHPFVYSFDPQNPETYVLYSEGPNTTITADNIYSGK